MKRGRYILLVLLIAAAAPWAAAKQFGKQERLFRELPILIGGTFILENGDGDVEIVGTDEPKIVLTILKTIHGADDGALAEGLQMTQIAFTGDERQRIVRTWVSPMRSGRWKESVSYSVRMPRTAHVRVVSDSSNHVRIADIRGSVGVKNLNGTVILDRVMGPSTVESANGNIVFNAPQRGLANTRLTSINGNIEVHAGTEPFQWVADLVSGDARTNLPLVRRSFVSSRFRGSFIGTTGPTVQTQSVMRNVFVIKSGSQIASAQSVRPAVPNTTRADALVAATMRQPIIEESFTYATPMGNIVIGEIRGDANISTGAGEIQLGLVRGECEVTSLGGPLNIGEIGGMLSARTDAGDVMVQAARSGGTIVSSGGTIRLLHNGGPMRLQSGGGDIVVSETTAPVFADTRSGDITITWAGSPRTYRTIAKTARGNVTLNVPPNFAADIDATIITTDADTNRIRTDIGTLSVRRETVGGRIRIRATGKINGGGDRVELFAEDGGIQILARPTGLVSPQIP